MCVGASCLKERQLCTVQVPEINVVDWIDFLKIFPPKQNVALIFIQKQYFVVASAEQQALATAVTAAELFRATYPVGVIPKQQECCRVYYISMTLQQQNETGSSKYIDLSFSLFLSRLIGAFLVFLSCHTTKSMPKARFQNKKKMEFSTKGLTPTPLPRQWEEKKNVIYSVSSNSARTLRNKLLSAIF